MRRSVKDLLPGMRIRRDYDEQIYVVGHLYDDEPIQWIVGQQDGTYRSIPFREDVEVIEEKSS